MYRSTFKILLKKVQALDKMRENCAESVFLMQFLIYAANFKNNC